MSDAPTPPASVPPPAEPPASAGRPWTILGRLAAAVREQNWFAVGLEVVIVVVGVVIGFQVTAWGQERTDRAREQTYLRQLAEDLRETEQHIAEVNTWLMTFEEGAGALQRSFYEPTRPSADSLLARLWRSGGFMKVKPITGTAEALVATGDLSLIRSDSLRSAITDYLVFVDDQNENQSVHGQAVRDAFFDHLMSGRGFSGDWEVLQENLFGFPETDLLYPFPQGSRRSTASLDPASFLSDTEAEKGAFINLVSRADQRYIRENLLDATVAFRQQVEAELDR